MGKTTWITIVKLVVSILVCQLAGFIGSLFTTPNIATWYAGIQKPAFNPPNWIFGPVWITLYVMMGIAAFLIWNKGWNVVGVKMALAIFLVQLILNSFWSIAFFGMHSPLTGFVVIVILWVAILVTMFSFFKMSTVAGWLLVPYILWVSFATVLNWSILILNKR